MVCGMASPGIHIYIYILGKIDECNALLARYTQCIPQRYRTGSKLCA